MSRTAAQIRREFIEFFEQRGHTHVPGSPVVPYDDPTLLFTNAGMNQFKPLFLGTADRGGAFGRLRRAVNSQPCIRAGGKHNDLDDVGHDTYHHTFFEMLGNWSFGDYFKRDAIAWAWELLTKVWGIDPARLHATYFGGDAAEGLDPDLEARDLWMQIAGLPPKRVHPGNKKDNFWEMGDTGPCGPCSEVHIDLTPDKSGAQLVNAGDARVMEIWNLVFIQFNRGADGRLSPLPDKHVDTGMGFERICSVVQGFEAGRIGQVTNYDTDVFTPIFAALADVTGAPAYGGRMESELDEPGLSRARKEAGAAEGAQNLRGAPDSPGREGTGQGGELPEEPDIEALSRPPLPHGRGSDQSGVSSTDVMRDVAYRVIADHIRTLAFAITDGAAPDKDGRGFVLRRILRRAVRYGWQYLNMHEPFLHRLAPSVVGAMGEAFPQLRKSAERVAEVLREEEESFARTLGRGIALFEEAAGRAREPRAQQLDPRAPQEERPQPSPDREGEASSTGTSANLKKPENMARSARPPIPGQRGAPEKPSVPERPQRPLPHGRGSAGSASFQAGVISGADAFKLHDTYGFPIDLTEVMAREKGLRVDIGEYERLMEEAREKARGSADTQRPKIDLFRLTEGRDSTHFVGHDQTTAVSTALLVALRDDNVETALRAGDHGLLILSETPFYAEQGGQIGDQGAVRGRDEEWSFRVDRTQRVCGVSLHWGICTSGIIAPRSPSTRANKPPLPPEHSGHCIADVDVSIRQRTERNHTATHILNWSLREVLGEGVQQKGSLVDSEKTRFDFSHGKGLTPDEITRIEQLCARQIADDLIVDTHDNVGVAQELALKINGLRAVFGEKYPDQVRVVSIGAKVSDLLARPDNPEWRKYSIEFCGGTHVKRTSEIGAFALVSEEAVAKGVRRLVGITGDAAKTAIQRGTELRRKAEQLAKASDAAALPERLAAVQKEIAEATLRVVDRAGLRELLAGLQEVVRKQQKAAAGSSAGDALARVPELLAQAEKRGDTTVVVAEFPDSPLDTLKTLADAIKQKAGSTALLLGVRQEPGGDPPAPAKALLLAAVTDDLIKRGIKAGDWIKAVAPIVDGGGGGPPTMAQAGGKNPAKLGEAFVAARAWIAAKLG